MRTRQIFSRMICGYPRRYWLRYQEVGCWGLFGSCEGSWHRRVKMPHMSTWHVDPVASCPSTLALCTRRCEQGAVRRKFASFGGSASEELSSSSEPSEEPLPKASTPALPGRLYFALAESDEDSLDEVQVLSLNARIATFFVTGVQWKRAHQCDMAIPIQERKASTWASLSHGFGSLPLRNHCSYTDTPGPMKVHFTMDMMSKWQYLTDVCCVRIIFCIFGGVPSMLPTNLPLLSWHTSRRLQTSYKIPKSEWSWDISKLRCHVFR